MQAHSKIRILRAAQFHEFVAQPLDWGQAGRGVLSTEDAHTACRR
jgi:hypothetical protein